jgi:hypothetical protein
VHIPGDLRSVVFTGNGHALSFNNWGKDLVH